MFVQVIMTHWVRQIHSESLSSWAELLWEEVTDGCNAHCLMSSYETNADQLHAVNLLDNCNGCGIWLVETSIMYAT